jgi:hypothetical protein
MRIIYKKNSHIVYKTNGNLYVTSSKNEIVNLNSESDYPKAALLKPVTIRSLSKDLA